MNLLLEAQNTLKELTELANLQIAENKMDDAENTMKSIDETKAKIEMLEKLKQNETVQAAQAIATMTPAEPTKATSPIDAINKALKNMPLTEAENSALDGQTTSVDADGGYLVPIEQIPGIKELNRTQVSLKDYCNVIPVNADSGTMPTDREDSAELVEVEELHAIATSKHAFGQVKFTIKYLYDLVVVSDRLIKSATSDVVAFIYKRFRKRAVRTENSAIVRVLENTEVINGDSHEALRKTLNTVIPAAVRPGAILITNQTGYDYLDGLTDTTGRPLLTDSLAVDGGKRFKGKEVIPMDDTVIPNVGEAMPFYIGNLYEYITFFDRENIIISSDASAGFTHNGVMFKACEGFDIQEVDAKAMAKVLITVGK